MSATNKDAPGGSADQSTKTPDELSDLQGEGMTLNMGPSPPSTHGVLRLVFECDR